MFVLSVKTSKKQWVRWGVWSAVILTALILVACLPSADRATVRGDTEQRRVAYLASLGYTADPASVEVREWVLPDEFDTVLEEYNRLQHTAGMDLSPYRNRAVKRYSYAVTGHPDTDRAVATLWVCGGNIVGGDVADAKADGFIQGLTPAVKK